MNNNQQPIASSGQATERTRSAYVFSASDGTTYVRSNYGYIYRMIDYNVFHDRADFDFDGFTDDMKYVISTAGSLYKIVSDHDPRPTGTGFWRRAIYFGIVDDNDDDQAVV
jgi:hypothetical protein